MKLKELLNTLSVGIYIKLYDLQYHLINDLPIKYDNQDKKTMDYLNIFKDCNVLEIEIHSYKDLAILIDCKGDVEDETNK